ncbi:MAG: hypothetical protein WDO15_28260 [Bacteroidota bacterium]
MKRFLLVALVLLTCCTEKKPAAPESSALYKFDKKAHTRWSSPENLNGEVGNGGKENDGGKGHPFDR